MRHCACAPVASCRSVSSETQGQLVGSIKCPWWKFTVRTRRAPGQLLLPNQFQKRLNYLLLIGQKKIFFWPINEEEQPGDSDVFLHDVVFLIDRYSCVARSKGKLSRGSFKLQRGYKKQTLYDEFLRRICRRYRKFWYAMRDFHFLHPHTHHIVVYSIQRQARIFNYISMFVARLLNLSTAWKFPLHGQL